MTEQTSSTPIAPEAAESPVAGPTTWDIPTVAQLLLRTVALITAIIAIYNIQSVIVAAEFGRAAGPIVATLLLLIGAVALWWFAEPLVKHMLKLRADAQADAEPKGESMIEAAKRTGLFEWHAMFLSLIGVFFLVWFGYDFLRMLFAGFEGVGGAVVFLTILMLAVAVLFVIIPKKILQWLPMYAEIRLAQAQATSQPQEHALAGGEPATAGAAEGEAASAPQGETDFAPISNAEQQDGADSKQE